MAIKSGEDKEKFQEFLQNTPNINSFYKINLRNDFLIECVFRNHAEMGDFIDKLREFKVGEINVFNIIQELKREDFLSEPEHFTNDVGWF